MYYYVRWTRLGVENLGTRVYLNPERELQALISCGTWGRTIVLVQPW